MGETVNGVSVSGRKVLVTGGAGFIGTHVVRRVLELGWEPTVLDNFSQQIHGDTRALASDIAPHVKLIVGDVRDSDVVARSLAGQDALIHLAADTGTGQSMYQLARYEQVNIGGSANLIDAIVRSASVASLSKVVVASSRAVYGEGKYSCTQDGTVYPASRTVELLRSGLFEPTCPVCGLSVASVPTDEASPLRPTSFYGLTKQTQEAMHLMYASSLQLPTFALRFQNVIGPGQSLTNPYTGILAIFLSLARKNLGINVFEDGRQRRDFVYVDDVVSSIAACLDSKSSGSSAINIGSGTATSVGDIAHWITDAVGSSSEVSVSGNFRVGDIRSNVADLNLAQQVLGYEPSWTSRAGVDSFVAWAMERPIANIDLNSSLQEMKSAGLFVEDAGQD